MADIQAINTQTAGRSHTPSPGLALLNSAHKPAKEDLVRQRLKTVKAVIVSAIDEIQFELQHQRMAAESCTNEDQLLIFATKANQINELLDPVFAV